MRFYSPKTEKEIRNRSFLRINMNSTNKTENSKEKTLIKISDYNFSYGDKQVLFDVNMKIPEKKVVAFIGPSGCGKSTLLRNINRMNDLVEGINHTGDISISG